MLLWQCRYRNNSVIDSGKIPLQIADNFVQISLLTYFEKGGGDEGRLGRVGELDPHDGGRNSGELQSAHQRRHVDTLGTTECYQSLVFIHFLSGQNLKITASRRYSLIRNALLWLKLKKMLLVNTNLNAIVELQRNRMVIIWGTVLKVLNLKSHWTPTAWLKTGKITR